MKSNNQPNKSQYPDPQFKEYLNQLVSPNYQAKYQKNPEIK